MMKLKKKILKNKAPIKSGEIIKTWATRTNLLPRSQDKDKLIEIEIKENSKVFFQNEQL